MKKAKKLGSAILWFTFGMLIAVATSKAQQPTLKARVATTPVPTVNLSCTPGAGGGVPAGFNFFRSTVTGGPYTILGPNPMSTACSCSDTTVVPGTTYYYVANAVNTAGASPYSNQATAVVPPAPTISAVSPNSGSTIGGTAVTITGTNFASGSTVTFEGLAATAVTVTSATSITATTPNDSSAGAVAVAVTSNGLTGSLSNAFTYIAPPNAPTALTAIP
jgi:hypothetical protein